MAQRNLNEGGQRIAKVTIIFFAFRCNNFAVAYHIPQHSLIHHPYHIKQSTDR